MALGLPLPAPSHQTQRGEAGGEERECGGEWGIGSDAAFGEGYGSGEQLIGGEGGIRTQGTLRVCPII